jgi:hypothetical protein
MRSTASPEAARRLLVLSQLPLNAGMAAHHEAPARRNTEARMHDIDAVLSELEWRRVRRRLTMPPGFALLCNVGTALIIFVLRHVPPAVAR